MEEVYEFDKQGRMTYHPDFHFNYGTPVTEDEKEYLCKFYETDDIRTLAFAVGRTEGSIRVLVKQMVRNGKYTFYKNRGLYY
ncbi:hypothetical protein [Bacillus sp. UNCCL81]|uniref:hypothetical protein n=1 Tax=Bacillus sp. UNCCL81 TaxID=1502755 RepID=UPI0008E9BACF|nr:hypothetical protein [Bacillus sp. UNCCL81]SFC52879.1 hypothetical protein SAMN02799633_01105 [Bacillus sp. UNCCL81]